MKKFTIKEIIDFRRKTIRTRENFIKKISKEKITTDSGGDYWISAVSALSRAFKTQNNLEITNKINDLLVDVENTKYKRTKMMYQRNLDILHNFEDFAFERLKPNHEIKFLKKPELLAIVEILKLPVKIKPTHVYTFDRKGIKYIGGLWLACKLNGYTTQELASFSEGLFKYLEKNYSTEYVIDTDYCIALDTFNGNIVSYSDIKTGTQHTILDATIPLIQAII